MPNLTGKRVVITGAAGGIGAATARALSAYGARVLLSDLPDSAVGELASTLRDEGRDAAYTFADVTVASQCEALVSCAVELFDGIDILFNCAGIMPLGTIVDMPEAVWRKVIDVNLTGTFLCSKYAIPIMRQQKRGLILNAASGAAMVGNRQLAAYGAAKAGILVLTKCMAVDHGKDGIRVNCICPGTIDTDMNRSWIQASADPDEALRKVGESHLVGRMGTAAEVAELVAFLASDACSYMTGSPIIFDGGLTVMGSRLA